MADSTYKLLTFDIDTKVASTILGEKGYRTIYRMIEAHMKDNDFSHTEGSVYISGKPITYPQLSMILNRLKEKYPFIGKAIRHSSVASVNQKQYQSNPLVKYDGTAGEYVGLYLRDADILKIKHDAEPQR